MALKDIHAVLFDVFGTVVDWRTCVAKEAESFLERHGMGKDNANAFADTWRSCYSSSMEEVRSGRRAFTRLDVLQMENLEAAVLEFGVDPKELPQEELEDLNLAWHRLDPWPD